MYAGAASFMYYGGGITASAAGYLYFGFGAYHWKITPS